MTKRVSVLMGGWSAEREVSLVSGAAVARALKDGGYAVTSIDVGRDPRRLIEQLTPTPDVVFNALHGRWGEDGCIQGLLDIMAVPYTHSGLLASALAMHKPLAKRVFAAAGIPIAEGRIVARDELLAGDPMPRPYVIKPLNEGSSVGVHIVHDETSRAIFSEGEWPFGRQVMIERFVPGRELTVAVMGDRALAVTEITTARDFYDYDAKYKAGGSRHVIPAALSPALYAETQSLALAAHRALGCRGVSRVDGERLVILEVNTQPGMTPTSLVPEQATYAGIPFAGLVGWMVENAEYDA